MLAQGFHSCCCIRQKRQGAPSRPPAKYNGSRSTDKALESVGGLGGQRAEIVSRTDTLLDEPCLNYRFFGGLEAQRVMGPPTLFTLF